MSETIEQKTYEFKADPFTFVFRELDILHREIIELKTDIKEIDKKFDNKFEALDKKIDDTSESLDKKIDLKYDALDKKLDRLYLIVIVTLIGTLGSLIKLLFF